MKITRRQLRRLIEGSVVKRGTDYVMPTEDPLKDPRDFDFDLSDKNKEKLLALAGSDDAETRTQIDSLADTLDFPSSGRFGADTLSTQMKMYDMDLDLLNDPEIDQLLDQAIELYFDQKGGYFADDLIDVMDMGYVYKDFQTFLDGDPNFDDSDGGNADLPMLHLGVVNSVMDKVNMLIGVKLMNLNYYNPNQSINISLTKDHLNYEDIALAKQLSPEELNQLTNKLRKAAELFKRRTSEESLPAVTQHVYDKMLKPMYKIYSSVIRKHPKGDFAKLKEGKMKLSRKELKKLIESTFDRRVTGPQTSGGPSSHRMFLDREGGRRYAESDQKFIDDCKKSAAYVAGLYEPKYPVGRGEGMTLEEIQAELIEEEGMTAEEIAGVIGVFEDLIGVLRSMSMGE